MLSTQPVDGELLADRLARESFAPDEAVREGVAIGNALAAIHATGAVHGSLSRYAIVLAETGAAIVHPQGSFDAYARPYRAPEQVRGKRAGQRSDHLLVRSNAI